MGVMDSWGKAVPNAALGQAVPFESLRVFGNPGASLQTAYELGEDARNAGIDGEQRVARELERLAAMYPNTYVFHSMKLPGHTGDIDHIVVQGRKVMLVDSKNWRSNSTYEVYRTDEDGDYILRDGTDFAGGEIHLRRQIEEWQREFRRDNLRVGGTLVVANDTSTAIVSINAPYYFLNMSGLEDVFARVFTRNEVPPMDSALLNRMLSMVDTVDGPELLHPNFKSARATKPETAKETKLLIGWAIFNWTVMWFFFPIAGLSSIALLVVAHRQRAKVVQENRGGKLALTAVLIWTYLHLAIWVPYTLLSVLHVL